MMREKVLTKGIIKLLPTNGGQRSKARIPFRHQNGTNGRRKV